MLPLIKNAATPVGAAIFKKPGLQWLSCINFLTTFTAYDLPHPALPDNMKYIGSTESF